MIEIIKGRVFWHEAFNNPPHLELLVNEMPKYDEYVYEERNGLYYAEQGPLCSFFSWSGHQDRGYGGRHFTLRMKDGSERVLMGPWSSNTAAMNVAGFGPCADASIIDDPVGYERGFTFTASAVSMAGLGGYRDRIAVTPYRINTEGSPWSGFNKMIVFPRGSRFTMLEVGSRTARVNKDVDNDQVLGLGEQGTTFIPIVELPDGGYWIKPRSHSVTIVPPKGAEVIDIPKKPGVWTGGE